MSSETDEIAMSLTDNSTAYIMTTIALVGGILSFYYFYIYEANKEEEEAEAEAEAEEEYEAVEARDLTLEELRQYDGKEGRAVCVAVSGIVYDVTKGKSFYGPGGPYEMLAGRDGSRALAKMSLDVADVRDEFDDLADLTPFQMDALNDWVMKFQTRYVEVGKLLKSRD